MARPCDAKPNLVGARFRASSEGRVETRSKAVGLGTLASESAHAWVDMGSAPATHAMFAVFTPLVPYGVLSIAPGSSSAMSVAPELQGSSWDTSCPKRIRARASNGPWGGLPRYESRNSSCATERTGRSREVQLGERYGPVRRHRIGHPTRVAFNPCRQTARFDLSARSSDRPPCC